MEYNFRSIEEKWHRIWRETNAYAVSNTSLKPKCYVLDMFPYPSGAGLHVGHPLGYIASDIYSRYKRLNGFNVLHPMGYDAFGLPAEQYAIEHGVHPATSTAKNIDTFRAQLEKIGFCYDWDRSINTSDPGYYKWTQWIFLQLFNSWYNKVTNKAENINGLITSFETEGNVHHPCPGDPSVQFSSNDWLSYDESQKMTVLMHYRLAFCGYGEVNWCEALGTVLANDEVINGLSERGGHPVIRKRLRQWYLRITDYADRLLEGLDTVDFSEAMKEMQTNWIGKSFGAEISFEVQGSDTKLLVYTTRPDTIYGVDFMVIAPEHDLIAELTSEAQSEAMTAYIAYVKSRSERERQAEKKISGCFTGSYAVNPFDGRAIPIWTSEYVLAGYGTGAIMAVPCGDERDFKFAQHFSIPITNILGDAFDGYTPNPTKDAILQNSGMITGLTMQAGADHILAALEARGIGKRKTNFRIRDAAFSRQRYWGEPFPITWKDGTAMPLDETVLPLELPHVDSYGPGPDGEGPLANIPEWVAKELETNTMPGYAGSSWYFLRYMDPQNTTEFCSRHASDYWNQVDIYIGGTEHAVGHLLYSRMWTKALFDLGYIGFDEPFKKLVNQGMIQGSSRFVYRITLTTDTENPAGVLLENPVFISKGYIDEFRKLEQQKQDADQYLYDLLLQQFPALPSYDAFRNRFAQTENGTSVLSKLIVPIHADVNFVNGLELDVEAFRRWKNSEYAQAAFILEGGKYICGAEVEKMSKSKFNTVNPDDLVNKYGADTFRMYEMFLGPVEISKPWDTKGIEGVHRFLKKLWRLFSDDTRGVIVTKDTPTDAEWKVIYTAVKKLAEDTNRFSFNTGVSALMICVNELTDLRCHKHAVLEKLLIILTPYAPHISEELWHFALGQSSSILDAVYPEVVMTYLVESEKEYPVSVNGKTRTTLTLPLDISKEEVEKAVLENEIVQKWMEGKPLKKLVFVPGRMVNVVV